MPADLARIADDFFRPALADLVAYVPGKPVEEVQRELGLDRVVKLASNEGPYAPFPQAVEAIEQATRELNRYPDGGAYALRHALAERHDVRFEEVAVGAGADGVIDCLSQAVLDPGDEVVFGWPSFPSYAIAAIKMGATPRRIPLREHRYDLSAMLDVIGPRTKLVHVCLPNNPTGTMNSRTELDDYFARVPEHVFTVLDQAYYEYVDHPDYPDGVDEYLKTGHRVMVLRTFSKIYGLAGLRVGYGVAPEAIVRELAKVRRAFDISTQAQAAALASLQPSARPELERRRRLNSQALDQLERVLRQHGLDPVVPAFGNFLYAEVGDDARQFFERLLAEGVIVRPLGGFGAPGAIRVTAGTPDEHEFLGRALERALAPASAG